VSHASKVSRGAGANCPGADDDDLGALRRGHSFVTTTTIVTALARICAIAPNSAT
jgi:hypothetical protein